MKMQNHIKQLLIVLITILSTTTCTYEWDNPHDELGNNYNLDGSGSAPIAAFTASI